MRRPAIIALGVLCLIGASLAASGAASATGASSKTKSAGGFPVTVSSGDGAVRIPARPTRILSLSPSATDMLYTIGAGKQVVGVDKYSTYPANAPRTKFTGSESSAEDYLPLRPDLVVLAFDSTHLVAQLKALHIPALLLPPVVTVTGVDNQLAELGIATGNRVGASRTVSSVAADLSSVASRVGSEARGDTYYVEFDPTLYTATSKTFIGALFSRFGMVDVADKADRSGAQYPQLSAEYLIKANPDYVFLADTICCGQDAKTFAARPGFSLLRAVKLHHIVSVNDSIASEWGPHRLESLFSVIAERGDLEDGVVAFADGERG